MFHLRRRKQESYWYIDDNDDGSLSSCVGQMGWQHRQESESIKASDPAEEKPVKPSPKISLEYAMSLQTKWTSWPRTIWEMNFEDADEEIVFEEDPFFLDDHPFCDSSCKKSVGTLDTEEETAPSSCSSPEFQNTWELEELDLSVILDEEDCGPASGPLYTLDLQDECALLECSAGLQKDILNAGSCRQSADTSSDSNYFLMEESFATLGSGRQQPHSFFPHKQKLRKRLRFADEVGKPMETIHVVHCGEEEDPTQRRILILMLLPNQRKYEFLHAEYSTESHLTVAALLKQLPGLASDPQIQKHKYIRLCRAAGGSELINALSIQSYDLSSDEILVAVLEGFTGKAMHEMAKALVENEKVLRAVKRTNKSAHTLHRLECKQRQSGGSRDGNTTNELAQEEKDDECAMHKHCSNNGMDTHTGKVLEINVSLGLRQESDHTTIVRSPSFSSEVRHPAPPKHVASNSNFQDNLQIERDGKSKSQASRGQETTQLVSSKEAQRKTHRKHVQQKTHTERDTTIECDDGLSSNHSEITPEKARDCGNRQKRVGFFGKKTFQRKPTPPRATQHPNQTQETTLLGKVFQRKPSPTRATQKSNQSEEGRRFGKVFPRKPSPTRAVQPSKQQGERASFFGKKVFQRKPSPMREVQPSSRSGETIPSHATKSHWASRFGKKRLGKV